MKKSPRSSARYVNSQAGWRVFFIFITLGCIFGLAFRIYFSPARIKGWVEHAVASQSSPIGLKFEGAQLRLARGAVPQLAIVLNDVAVAVAPDCHPEPSLRIAELFVPFNVASFFRGDVQMGTVAAEDIVADLDGLKKRCPTTGEQQARGTASADGKASAPADVSEKVRHASAAQPWWTDSQLRSVQNLVAGFEFKRVELQFENRKKKVFLDSFEAASEPGEDTVSVSTRIRIPPELTYGETLPPLVIEAVARADKADLKIESDLSEGILRGTAVLRPSEANANQVTIESQLAVDDLPLSTIEPLLVKAKILNETFKPKFLWLDCSASIQGQFQGLFRSSPLKLENCSIEGDGTLVKLESATRKPDGRWEPFQIQIAKANLKKLFDTFSLKGPDGIAEQFGHLSGMLHVGSSDDAKFLGSIEDVVLRFSNRKVRAFQKISEIETEIHVKGEAVTGELSKIQLEQGELAGSVQFDLARNFRQGDVRLKFDRVSFGPQVEAIMLGGSMDEASIEGHGKLEDGAISSIVTQMRLRGVKTPHFLMNEAEIEAKIPASGLGKFVLRSPEVQVKRESNYFTSAHPLFFEHEFEGEWIPLQDVALRTQMTPMGGWRWENSSATLEGGKIRLAAEGTLSPSQTLSGSVMLDYPTVKRLKWALSGSPGAPILTDDSNTLEELRKRLRVDDRALGLPLRTRATETQSREGDASAESSIAEKTKSGLKQLSAKVLEKARRIVPQSQELLKEKQPE